MMQKLIVALVILLTVLPRLSFGQTPSASSLKGYNSFGLTFDLEPSFKDVGVNEDKLRTMIELKLRMTGIRVLPQTEVDSIKGRPVLDIEIYGNKMQGVAGYDVYFYSTSLAFWQDCELLNKRDYVYRGATWMHRGLGECGGDYLVNEIQKNISDHVDKFLNDFLSANPK